MPTEKFYDVWKSITTKDLDEQIKILSNKFPESLLPIIIKINFLNLIDRDTFNNTYSRYKNDYTTHYVNASLQKATGQIFFL
jgi:hypothetical protein